MNWFHTWLVKIVCKPLIYSWLVANARELGLYGTLDSEVALREKNRIIIELEKALAERPIIYIHTPMLQIAAAPQPREITGPLPALGMRGRARQREFQQQLNSQPTGTFSRLDAQMRRQKQTTGQLGPITERLPAAPKQGAITRDLRGLLSDDTEDTKNVS